MPTFTSQKSDTTKYASPKIIPMLTPSAIRSNWLQLCEDWSVPMATAEACWQPIEAAYTAPDRHYHNLDHLQGMIFHFHLYEDLLEEPESVLFSIFYHDLVYDVARPDNEAQSAALAAEVLPWLGRSQADIERCQQFILATQAHAPTEDVDTQYLLDFDLAILGADPIRYEAYTRQIRAEYARFPDEIYRPGRRQVLQRFLARPTIFQTPEFQDQYEAEARENLFAEFQSLA